MEHFQNLKHPPIILASKSQSRKMQLQEEGLNFEVVVSNADESCDEGKSFRNQLAEISMRKALAVLEKTKEKGLRLIVAGDQNIVFENKKYGKPKTLDEARKLIEKMSGSKQIYAYTGNAILLAEGKNILQSLNITDVARMSMIKVAPAQLNDYLATDKCLSFCGGISICFGNLLNLEEGRLSTARGLTVEYIKEFL